MWSFKTQTMRYKVILVQDLQNKSDIQKHGYSPKLFTERPVSAFSLVERLFESGVIIPSSGVIIHFSEG